VQLIELDTVTHEQWVGLGAEEPGAWGGGVSEAWEWREKDLHLGLLAPDGSLVATAEAALIEIAIDGGEAFDVVGIGGVFVRAPERGRGLMRGLFDELLRRGREMGPERAMLFCRAHLVPFYAGFGFNEIADPVWADQAGRRVQVPMCAMWLALHGRPGWPPGRADVQGLPF